MSNALRKKFFFQEGKKEYLVNFLTQDLDNLNYHLILVSCYFKLNSAKNLIESLLKVKK
ncbi:hypothetical protein [Nostoc foliaceum]|uniref:hypothetical protein n=1 Tax=Nostoc foliaceum TaxID=2692914 RepID=UPI001685C4E9|nr:hypothetical protein [Nostoc foliaceum]